MSDYKNLLATCFRSKRAGSLLRVGFALGAAAWAWLALIPAAAAGQASAGELLFYPCARCHPVRGGTSSRVAPQGLPNDFQGHQIVLAGHDKLGQGGRACLVCHDSPARNPGMLKLADGSFIYITGDISRVCYRCHSSKYKEWKAGMHGKRQPKCTAGGCHDPHTPQWVYASPLMPFLGTGIQARAVSERRPFEALAPPANPPPVDTPYWLKIAALLGLVLAGGMAGSLALGRSKR